MTDEKYPAIDYADRLPDRVRASEEAAELFGGPLGPTEVDPGDPRTLKEILDALDEHGTSRIDGLKHGVGSIATQSANRPEHRPE